MLVPLYLVTESELGVTNKDTRHRGAFFFCEADTR